MTVTAEAAYQAHRVETRTVPAQPPAGHPEDGLTQYARELARVLCAALDGHTWRAQTQAPYLPHSQAAHRHAVAVAVDRRWLVTVTATTPAGTTRDLWITTVNGRPVPPRLLPRELPSTAQAIARSVRQHLAGLPAEPCDSIGCHNPPTVATYGRSLCVPCAGRRTEGSR